MTNNQAGASAIECARILTDLQEKLNTLNNEKRDHFLFTLNALMDCYIDEKERALLLLTSSARHVQDSISLIAVNANEAETEELIDTLCVFRKLDFSETGNLAN